MYGFCWLSFVLYSPLDLACCFLMANYGEKENSDTVLAICYVIGFLDRPFLLVSNGLIWKKNIMTQNLVCAILFDFKQATDCFQYHLLRLFFWSPFLQWISTRHTRPPCGNDYPFHHIIWSLTLCIPVWVTAFWLCCFILGYLP